MKRRVMVVVLAGTLLVIVGAGALATIPMGGGKPDHPTVMHEAPTEIRSHAGGAEIGFTDGSGAIAGSKPGVGVGSGGGSNAEISAGDANEPGADEDAIAGSKPGLGAGSGGLSEETDLMQAGGLRGGVVLGTEPVQMGGPGGVCDILINWRCNPPSASQVNAGGLRGGVVLRDDPVQMGGAGGLCSPPHHDCNDLQSQVLAGGLRGGVVLGTDVEPNGGKGGIFGDDVANAGGLRGGVVLGTDPMIAGGRGGIFGDVAR